MGYMGEVACSCCFSWCKLSLLDDELFLVAVGAVDGVCMWCASALLFQVSVVYRKPIDAGDLSRCENRFRLSV